MKRNAGMDNSGVAPTPGGLARRQLLLAGGAAVVLAGCGGGGGDDNPVPGGGGDPQGGSAFTAEQRIAATERIAVKFEELTAGGAATDAAWAALRDWVLTQPEFTAAEVGDQLVWARFRDGRHFVYSDNWRPLDAGLANRAATAAQGLREARTAQALAGGGEVPASDNACILSFTAPEFAQEGSASLARMASALKERGWQVAPDRALTVDALRNRGELGFFFLTSHSGLFGPEGEKEFSVMTDTVVTVANELAYAGELFAGRLIYHRDRTLWQRLGRADSPRYAITTRFVRQYLKFSAGSLVIMLSCNSGADKADGLQAALVAQGAGTLIGWNGNSNGHAFEMIDVLMDRLTGSNGLPTPTPPGRAFDMDDVWAHLSRNGLLVTPPAETGGRPSFVIRFGNGFNLSNPVITELQVKAQDRLVIHGNFGTTRGTVTVGGTPVAVDSWSGSAIELTLPTATNDPPGSTGDVVVKARARTSNPRTLTSWRGVVSYTLENIDEGGILSHTIRVRLHLRGDAFARRTQVDGDLLPNTWNVIPASDTVITYEASGTRDHGDGDLETWSGNGSYELVSGVFPASEPKMALYARVDAIHQRLELTALPPNVAPGIVRNRPEGDPTYPSGLMIMPPFEMQFMNENGNLNDHAPLIYGNYLPFGATGTIGASQHMAEEGDMRRTVRWAAMTALPALDDRIGR